MSKHTLFGQRTEEPLLRHVFKSHGQSSGRGSALYCPGLVQKEHEASVQTSADGVFLQEIRDGSMVAVHMEVKARVSKNVLHH